MMLSPLGILAGVLYVYPELIGLLMFVLCVAADVNAKWTLPT